MADSTTKKSPSDSARKKSQSNITKKIFKSVQSGVRMKMMAKKRQMRRNQIDEDIRDYNQLEKQCTHNPEIIEIMKAESYAAVIERDKDEHDTQHGPDDYDFIRFQMLDEMKKYNFDATVVESKIEEAFGIISKLRNMNNKVKDKMDQRDLEVQAMAEKFQKDQRVTRALRLAKEYRDKFEDSKSHLARLEEDFATMEDSHSAMSNRLHYTAAIIESLRSTNEQQAELRNDLELSLRVISDLTNKLKACEENAVTLKRKLSFSGNSYIADKSVEGKPSMRNQSMQQRLVTNLLLDTQDMKRQLSMQMSTVERLNVELRNKDAKIEQLQTLRKEMSDTDEYSSGDNQFNKPCSDKDALLQCSVGSDCSFSSETALHGGLNHTKNCNSTSSLESIPDQTITKLHEMHPSVIKSRSETYHKRESYAGNSNKVFLVRDINAGNSSEVFSVRDSNAGNSNEVFLLRDSNAGNSNEVFSVRDVNAGNSNEVFLVRENNAGNSIASFSVADSYAGHIKDTFSERNIGSRRHLNDTFAVTDCSNYAGQLLNDNFSVRYNSSYAGHLNDTVSPKDTFSEMNTFACHSSIEMVAQNTQADHSTYVPSANNRSRRANTRRGKRRNTKRSRQIIEPENKTTINPTVIAFRFLLSFFMLISFALVVMYILWRRHQKHNEMKQMWDEIYEYCLA